MSLATAWLLEVDALEKVGAAWVDKPLRFGTHGLLTLPTDSLPTKTFLPYLDGPPSWSAEVTPEGEAATRRGAFELADPQQLDGTALLDELAPLKLEGRPFRAFRAAANPEPPASFDAYTLTLAGTIESRRRSRGKLLLVPVDPMSALDVELDLPRFLGLGPSCLRMVSAGYISLPQSLAVSGDWTFQALLRPQDVTVTNQRLVRQYDGVDGLLIRVSPSASKQGEIHVRMPNLTPDVIQTSTAPLADGDRWPCVTVLHDSGKGARQIWVDDEMLVEDTYTGSVSAASDALSAEILRGMEADALELRWWSRVLTEDEIGANFNRGVEPDAETGLVHLWRFNNEIVAATDFAGTNHGTINSGTWVASGEGGPELEDVPEPLALGGPIRNVSPILTSGPDRLYRFGQGPLRALPAVRFRGGDLVEGAPGPGTNYTMDLAAGELSVHDLAASDPGGLTLDIEGWDDGSWYPQTIADVVRWLVTRAGPLADADLDAAVFGIGQASTFPDQEPVELWLPSGGNLLEVLKGFCRPFGAFPLVDELGVLTLVRLDAPAGTPDVELAHEDFLWTRSGVQLEIFDRLPPTASQSVAWGYCYTVQQEGDLIQAVDPELRAFVGSPWRKVRHPAPRSVREDYPEALDGELVEAHYTQRSSAILASRWRQGGLYGAAGLERIRGSLGRPVDGLRLGGLVEITSPAIDAAAGRLYRITKVDYGRGPFGGLEAIG